MESDTPPFILEKLKFLRSSKTLVDSVGGFTGYEYSYNKNDYRDKDTLRYSIRIEGTHRVILYKGVHVKDTAQLRGWRLFKDTLQID
jgi:hypothetical protein